MGPFQGQRPRCLPWARPIQAGGTQSRMDLAQRGINGRPALNGLALQPRVSHEAFCVVITLVQWWVSSAFLIEASGPARSQNLGIPSPWPSSQGHGQRSPWARAPPASSEATLVSGDMRTTANGCTCGSYCISLGSCLGPPPSRVSVCDPSARSRKVSRGA